MHAKCPVYLLDMITLCLATSTYYAAPHDVIFLYLPDTFFLLRSNIFLSTLISNTLSLCSSFE
jgi:hypothetical protein